jgi:hypothetical protein
MTTAPNAAPKNIAATAATLLANLGLFPFANEESVPSVAEFVAIEPGIRRQLGWNFKRRGTI